MGVPTSQSQGQTLDEIKHRLADDATKFEQLKVHL